MTGIELIPAALVHAPLLAGMHHVCFKEPWTAQSMQASLEMPGSRGVIAVDGGALQPSLHGPGPAGFVLWRAVAGEAEILTIAVLPPWRRRGVGRLLMRAALDSVGDWPMYLEVAVDNLPAQALYGNLGFAQVGRRKAYYGETDAFVMRFDPVIAQ